MIPRSRSEQSRRRVRLTITITTSITVQALLCIISLIAAAPPLSFASAQNATVDPCYRKPLQTTGGITLPITLCSPTALCANWCWMYAVSEVSTLLHTTSSISSGPGKLTCSAVVPCTMATQLTNYNYYWTGESYNCCTLGCSSRVDSDSYRYCQDDMTADTLRYMLAVHGVYGASVVTTTATTTATTGTVQSVGGEYSAPRTKEIGLDPDTNQLNATFLQYELSQARPVILGFGGASTDGSFGAHRLLVVYGFDVGANSTVQFLATDPCDGITIRRTYSDLRYSGYGNSSWTTSLFQLTYGGYCNPITSTSPAAAAFKPLTALIASAVFFVSAAIIVL